MTGRPRAVRLVSGTRQYPLLQGEWLIGRSADAGIAITDALASREHAVLKVNAEAVVIEDLGSRNGTFVNDRKVDEPTALLPGDLLRIGDTVFGVEVESAELAAEGGWEEPARPVKIRPQVKRGGASAGVAAPSLAAPGTSSAAFSPATAATPRSAADPPSSPGSGARGSLEESTSAGDTLPAAARGQRPARAHVEITQIIEPRTALLVLRHADRDWADQIRRAASIHPNLSVRVAQAALAAQNLADVQRGILVLDVDAAGDARGAIQAAWSAPRPRGPVLIAGDLAEHEGAVLARKLSASGYVRRAKSAILVVAQLRYHLQRAEAL